MFEIKIGNQEDITELGKLQYEDYFKSEPYLGRYPWMGYCFVIKNDGKIIAGFYAGGTKNFISDTTCDVLFIHNIFVDDQYRNYSFTQKMLAKAEQLAKDAGAGLVYSLQIRQEVVNEFLAAGYKSFAELKDAPIQESSIFHLKKTVTQSNSNSNEDFSIFEEGSLEDGKWLHEQNLKNFVPWPPHDKQFEWTPLALIARDNEGNFVGGISGAYNRQDSFFIHLLFVKKEYRHQGLGSRLLSEITREIKKVPNVKCIYCFTVNPVAKKMYVKHGFEVYATLEDAPLKGSKMFFIANKV